MDWAAPSLTIIRADAPPTIIRGELGIPPLPLIPHVQVKAQLRQGDTAAMIYVAQSQPQSKIPDEYQNQLDKYSH